MKEQAEQISNEFIDQARKEAKAMVASSAEVALSLFEKVQESNRARETDGRDAWSNLKRLGGQKLPAGDEVVIARHLFDEMAVVKKQLRIQKIGIGQFCIKSKISDASESSKELHRLTLSPGKDPAGVRPRRSAGKYRSLIEAISKTTKESTSTLADRVLRGTSLHPANMEDLSETEMVHAALQRIVNKIDDEFGVHAKFMEVAELKARHLAEGGTTHWPLWGPYIYPSPSPDDVQIYEQELEDAKDKRFSFWKRPHDPVDPVVDHMPWPMAYGSDVLQNNDFFYVPHAALGFLEYVNLPSRKESPARYEATVQSTVERWHTVDQNDGWTIRDEWAVTDGWDEEEQRPVGQVDSHSCRGSEFAWIVIYPMPDGSRLMPMLYISHQEGGAYLLPLDTRNLEIFREAIWISETEHMTVFDRIKELLGYRPGSQRAIEHGFCRTAPWLDHNPFFKMRRQRKDDLHMLGAFCHQLWEEKKSC